MGNSIVDGIRNRRFTGNIDTSKLDGVNQRISDNVDRDIGNTVNNATRYGEIGEETAQTAVRKAQSNAATDLSVQQSNAEASDFLRNNPIPEFDFSANYLDTSSLGIRSSQLNNVGFNQLSGVRAGLATPDVFNIARSLECCIS